MCGMGKVESCLSVVCRAMSGRHTVRGQLQCNKPTLGVADRIEAGATETSPWIALASSLGGIDECNHAEGRNIAVSVPRAAHSVEDQCTAEDRPLIAEGAANPSAGPCVFDELRERPRCDPERIKARGFQHEAPSWWSKLRAADLLAVVVPVSKRHYIGISTMTHRPIHAAILSLILAGCQPRQSIQVVTCPSIPVSLTRDCGRCLPDDPTPATNGALAEAWLDCRQCVAEYRIRVEAVRELAGCR